MPAATTGYDFIIIGAGTAGSTLASRLTDDPACRVLVLEAGGPDNGFWLKLPVGYFRSIYDPRYSHHYKSDPVPGIDNRQMDCPRGRVIGGSSSINGLIYIRGQHQDFDDWADMGATGWSYKEVLPHFRAIETFSGPPSQHRGAHGPVQVSELRNDNAACTAWLEAARSTGLPDNPDFNGADSYGVGAYQLTLRGRWRDSAASAFLKPAVSRPNLTLIPNAAVTELVFDGDRAAGLKYHHQGRVEQVQADGEILLCAGAVQSPQLLQLAGIGPAELLQRLNINVRVDAPEVGQNLQDHLQIRTLVQLADHRLSLNQQVRTPLGLAKMGLQWLLAGSGPLTVGAGQVGGAACSKYATNGRPDLQLFVMPLSVDKPGSPLHDYPGFTASVWQCHPHSRGTVQIKDTNPLSDPIIQPNYLSDARDGLVMVDGVKTVRQIYQQPAFKDFWTVEKLPGPDVRTDEQILAAIRQNAATVYHLSGTCRMGSDTNAPLDPELRVNGIRGLRVIDASVMPRITAANINAPTYMIAEKAADMLRHR